MPSEPPGQSREDTETLLSVAEAAARAGMKPSSWRAGVSRGDFPPPDDPDTAAPKQRRRPRWRPATVDAFTGSRPGQGKRTDLVTARKDRGRRYAAELAETPASTGTAMNEWLQGNHRALLAVAETLVDHREALLAAAGDASRDGLAEAIDRAGEEISGRPSRLLASAVTYAQFLLRSIDTARAPAEARQALSRHDHLHAEFNRLRDPAWVSEAVPAALADSGRRAPARVPR